MVEQVTIELINSREYLLGDNMDVAILLSNHGNEVKYVTTPVTSSGKLKSDIFDVKQGEKSVPYRGMFVKAKDSFISLFPNSTIEFSLSIGREYGIINEGHYSLSLSDNNYLDVLSYTEHVNSSFSVIKTVGASAASCWHDLEKENSIVAKPAYKTFGTNLVFQATDKQLAALIIAHNKALEALQFVNTEYQNSKGELPNTLSKHYKDLFCSSNKDWQNTLKKFDKIQDFLKSDVSYRFKGRECDDENMFGYVFKNELDKNIYLCDAYNEAPTFPTQAQKYDTKAGVIIHESSHLSVNSEDHFYSINKCYTYAKLCADNRTITNADCLQIFAELSYLGKDNISNYELEIYPV